MKTLLAIALCTSSVFLTGCGGNESPLPPTYPASGKILDAKGQPYAKEGLIEFRHLAKPEFSNGRIQPNGQFILETLMAGKRLPGAQEGEHHVTIMPNLGADQGVKPIVLKKRYTIKSGENQLTIQLE